MLQKKYFYIIFLVFLILPLPILILFTASCFIHEPYETKDLWFKESFDDQKYILECKKDGGVNPSEYIRIYDSDGDAIYDMSFNLRSDYHHGRYTYKVKHEENYIKLSFINENNNIYQAYRFYYDDLDELEKIKEKD